MSISNSCVLLRVEVKMRVLCVLLALVAVSFAQEVASALPEQWVSGFNASACDKDGADCIQITGTVYSIYSEGLMRIDVKARESGFIADGSIIRNYGEGVEYKILRHLRDVTCTKHKLNGKMPFEPSILEGKESLGEELIRTIDTKKYQFGEETWWASDLARLHRIATAEVELDLTNFRPITGFESYFNMTKLFMGAECTEGEEVKADGLVNDIVAQAKKALNGMKDLRKKSEEAAEAQRLEGEAMREEIRLKRVEEREALKAAKDEENKKEQEEAAAVRDAEREAREAERTARINEVLESRKKAKEERDEKLAGRMAEKAKLDAKRAASKLEWEQKAKVTRAQREKAAEAAKARAQKEEEKKDEL